MAKDLSGGLLQSLIQWLLTIGRAFSAKKDPARSRANRGVLWLNHSTHPEPESTPTIMSINWDTVRYFERDEFGHVDGVEPCPLLVAQLDNARDLAGVPFVITSGIRSPERNAEVGGSPASAHLTGHAVDVWAKDSGTRFAIVQAALQAGFTRIGCGRNFVHLDTDTSKPSPSLWTY